MICPQCGSTQDDQLKFCKSCGANLHALRQVLQSRGPDEKFDWSRTWIAEMFMSSEEAVRHQAELDRIQGITPEVKRRREIKAGVITASAGLGVMILLFVLMGGIVASGRVSDAAAEILSRLWIVGIIPVLVGFALIFNGMFVSKRGEEHVVKSDDAAPDTKELKAPAAPPFLSPADTTDLASATPFSVTDDTTRHLQKTRRRNSES